MQLWFNIAFKVNFIAKPSLLFFCFSSAIEEETSLDKSTNSSMLQDTERDDDEGSVEKAETEANQTTTTAAPTAGMRIIIATFLSLKI